MLLTTSLRFTRTLSRMWPAAAALALGACAPPTPYHDDDIGLQGVSTEPGALAGTFAHKVFAATLVQVPLLPEELGGGFQWLRMERRYDAEQGHYVQQSQLCHGQNLEVHGTVADVPMSTYRAVPPSEDEVVEADPGSGEYGASGLVQLWGLRGLDDPAKDPLPATLEEADREPFASQIHDMDGDGERGYTTTVSGTFQGRAFGVLRRQTTYRGVVLSTDRVVGLASTDYDSLIFGADNDFVKSMMDSKAPAYPDPKESWFEEIRLPDEADCDAVMDLEESGALSRLRPF